MQIQTNTSMQVQNRACPICGSVSRYQVFSCQATPLGDRYSSSAIEAKSLPFYPIELVRCFDCLHIYIPFFVDQDESYKHYLFHSGRSPGLSGAFQEIVSDLCVRHKLSTEDLILDIGANDGLWLSKFMGHGCKLLAVEPSISPVDELNKKGIPVVHDYFSSRAVVESGKLCQIPRLVTLNYVFANLPHPIEIIDQILSISGADTVISIITGYHPAQLSVKMFDYVYHEHLSYYTLLDFENIAKRFNLSVTHVRELPLKGGSIHIEMKRGSVFEHSYLFQSMLQRERWLDQPSDFQWMSISDQIRETKEWLGKVLAAKKKVGSTVVGYGASHSTTTLASSLELVGLVDFLVDDNPYKHGMYSPGAAIPVFPPSELTKYENAVVVILAWQHGEKILQALKSSSFHGIVITPFPVISNQSI
jgi:hypothetical protein